MYPVDIILGDYEVEVLKEAAGQPNSIDGWGAATGAAIERLRGLGYLSGPPVYKPTEKGLKYLKVFT
jgi:hypothetical protein